MIWQGKPLMLTYIYMNNNKIFCACIQINQGESFILTHVLIKYFKIYFYLISTMETIINTKVVVNFQKSLMVAKRRIEINDNDKSQGLDQKLNHKRITLTKIINHTISITK